MKQRNIHEDILRSMSFFVLTGRAAGGKSKTEQARVRLAQGAGSAREV